MEPLSVFITTFDNERTLRFCLDSVKWADEIVLVDSLSTDRTLEIAESYGCRIFRHPFLGYGRQKQLALDKTRHRWVLLLDSDEALTPELQDEIREVLRRGPDAAGYAIPRLEQMYWRMAHRRTRLTHFLRLFDKTKGKMTDMPVHAAPVVDGTVKRLRHPFYHFSNFDIHARVRKANDYSTDLVSDKLGKGRRGSPWMMVFYPPVYFLRQYVLHRNFLNGWSGFIGATISAFYAFLKYAKLYQHHELERHGASLLPPGAPQVDRRTDRKPA
jgi:glycosyltransferase involved in cell wall biosynthesis